VQQRQGAKVRVFAGQLPQAVAEQRPVSDFGFMVMLPEDFLGYLQRVNAGEHPLDVFAEVTLGSERVDKDGDDDHV
jgi:hypothetical protein